MPSLGGATQEEVRRHNIGGLLRILHVRGETSRADLTALTGLNRSTVGALAGDLALAGLVREIAPVVRGGAGRPSIVVAPENTKVFVVAVDVSAHRLTAVRIGLGGEVFDRRELLQTPADHSVRRTLGRTGRLISAVLEGAPEGSTCVGVGIGVCGLVRSGDGLVRFAPNLGWVDVPFGRLVRDLLPDHVPVTVRNDADLGATAEHVRGAAVGAKNVIYLAGDVGVGGGLIVDGVSFGGAGGYAGEVGHMIVKPGGRPCRCGARGCWETEIGEGAILLGAGLESGRGTDVEQVTEAAASGDPRATAVLREVGRWLGIGLANLVTLFNPEVVIFGGVLRKVFPAVCRQVHQGLDLTLTAPREQVRLVLPAMGPDSVIVGAAEAAFRPLLDDPLGFSASASIGPPDAAGRRWTERWPLPTDPTCA